MADTDEQIIEEAQRRFKAAEEWESSARNHWRDDLSFTEADAYDLRQWPDEVSRPRLEASKPCITVNRVAQHVLAVCNDMRANKMEVVYRPAGGDSTFKSAEILNGVYRHIAYGGRDGTSADEAYDTATWFQVAAGYGAWRITTKYLPDSFDQEVYVQRIADPMSVLIDTDCNTYDTSDKRWAIIFDDIPHDKFAEKYPAYADKFFNQAPLGSEGTSYMQTAWKSKDHIRVAEYYRRVSEPDTLYYTEDGLILKDSEIEDERQREKVKKTAIKTRKTENHKIEWYLMAGNDVIDHTDVPGTMIPVVVIYGQKSVRDGTFDYRGLTRTLLDSQRLYNMFVSASVEATSLQTKVPWLISAEALEGYSEMWASANTTNWSHLVWNSYDDVGQREVPPPQRIEPPSYPQAYQQGAIQAAQDMAAASGQQDAYFGMESNERSGRAINERVRRTQNSVFHFTDHFAKGLRLTGKIILEYIQAVYDVPRLLTILNEDGTQAQVQIDPNAPNAHQPMQPQDGSTFTPDEVVAVMNPNLGLYSCEADTGPTWGTLRQESFNAISSILQQNESLTPIIGDLLFKSADFPYADQIAERMRNMLPPQAMGNGPNPQVQQLSQLLSQQQQLTQGILAENQQLKNKAVLEAQQKTIDDYDSQTRRLAVVSKADPAALQPVIRQMVSAALGESIHDLMTQNTLRDAFHQAMSGAIQQPAAGPNGQMQPGPQAPQAPNQGPQQ